MTIESRVISVDASNSLEKVKTGCGHEIAQMIHVTAAQHSGPIPDYIMTTSI